MSKEKVYPITCPYCGKEQLCHKSLFHFMGMLDLGGGDCLGCKKHMRVIYDPTTDSMTTRRCEEFLDECKERKKKKGEENGIKVRSEKQ